VTNRAQAWGGWGVTVTEPVVTVKGVANHAKVNQLDASQGSEVPAVSEFPDVFLKVLPGMPPDQDIGFVIELKPDTTAIYETPFRMTTPELAELKDHIKELLEKGFIHHSSSPWGAPCDFCPEEGWYSDVVRGLSCPE
jgi:hypothetical protein